MHLMVLVNKSFSSYRLMSSIARECDSAIYDVCYNPTIAGMAAVTDWSGNVVVLEWIRADGVHKIDLSAT